MITNITAVRPNGTLQHFGVCLEILSCYESPETTADLWLQVNFPDYKLFETTVRYRAS